MYRFSMDKIEFSLRKHENYKLFTTETGIELTADTEFLSQHQLTEGMPNHNLKKMKK